MKNKILIADQQAQMRHLHEAVFTQQGYKVKTIFDNDIFSIVINDKIPVINASQIINWLENNEIYNQIFIIGSPYDDIEKRTNSFSAVKLVLRQPFIVQELGEKVDSVIQ